MSASDNLSQELFFTVHRGISKPNPKPLNKELGTHWTTQEDIAHELADRQQTGHDFYYSPEHRTIIHGEVPMSSVETNIEELDKGSVFSSGNLNKNIEKEVPIKRGAKVRVTGITKIYKDPRLDKDTGNPIENRKMRTRKRTYSPPREMQA